MLTKHLTVGQVRSETHVGVTVINTKMGHGHDCYLSATSTQRNWPKRKWVVRKLLPEAGKVKSHVLQWRNTWWTWLTQGYVCQVALSLSENRMGEETVVCTGYYWELLAWCFKTAMSLGKEQLHYKQKQKGVDSINLMVCRSLSIFGRTYIAKVTISLH